MGVRGRIACAPPRIPKFRVFSKLDIVKVVTLLQQYSLGQGLQTIYVIQIKPLQHDAL